MKLKLYSSFLLLSIIFLASCRSASKLYDKGNYDESVQVAVKKLQKDPNNPKLQRVIQDAYKYAVRGHQDRISSFAQSNDELKWEWIYNEYAGLQNLYEAIYRAPSVFELVNPENYSSYLTTYADKAAETRISRGMHWMDDGSRQGFKNAYYEFQSALNFRPTDINTKQMLDQAYNGALVKVLVMPSDDRDYRFANYYDQFPNFDKNILRDLQNNTGSQFVRYFSTWDAQRMNIVPDEIIDLRFTQLNIGHISDNRTVREVSKKVVVKETVYKPDSVIKEYATVKANITTTKRDLYSEGSLTINVRDNTGRWLWNDNLRAGHNWSTSFTTYTGDERALSDDDKKLLTTTQLDAPREDEIIRCIKETIYSDLLHRLRNHYSQY